MNRRNALAGLAALSAPGAGLRAQGQSLAGGANPLAPLLTFYQLLGGDDSAGASALQRLRSPWSEAYTAPLIELFQFVPNPRVQAAIARLLREVTGRAFNSSLKDRKSVV